jgi:hypothetical protein
MQPGLLNGQKTDRFGESITIGFPPEIGEATYRLVKSITVGVPS